MSWLRRSTQAAGGASAAKAAYDAAHDNMGSGSDMFTGAGQERIVCSITAAVKYEVSANIVLAVAEKESGRAGR